MFIVFQVLCYFMFIIIILLQQLFYFLFDKLCQEKVRYLVYVISIYGWNKKYNLVLLLNKKNVYLFFRENKLIEGKIYILEFMLINFLVVFFEEVDFRFFQINLLFLQIGKLQNIIECIQVFSEMCGFEFYIFEFLCIVKRYI